MARHGAFQHYIRPDAVYRTGVIQPAAYYNPVEDAQAVAAEFVAAPGLAGLHATVHRGHLGGPLASRWAAFKARVKTRLIANRIIRDTGTVPAALVSKQITLDASPRGPSPYAGAVPTTNGWAPQPQTPASVVPSITRAGDPPTAGAVATAIAMDPAGAAWPADFWAKVVGGNMNPLVAQRAETDVLRRWFRAKADRAQTGWPPPATGWA